MTSSIGPGRPPVSTRFRKGQSGNPKGRPKAQQAPSRSAFQVILDRTVEVTQNGKPREVTIEEAIQHRTLEEGLSGNRAAGRTLLKMIEKREKWFAKNSADLPSVTTRFESDPDNVDNALLLLDIAEVDTNWGFLRNGRRRLLLQSWAAQRALSRGRQRLSPKDCWEIERCTINASTLRWPAGSKARNDDDERFR